MGIITQHFIIEGKYLGQATREKHFVHASLVDPCSLLFYCEACGEVYAKCPVEGAAPGPWLAYRKLCRRCDSVFAAQVPGSILLSWDSDFTAAFPVPVLWWEFERHADWFERK